MEPTTKASRLLSFLLAEKSVRGVILDGTVLVREMQLRHGIGRTETLILGQALLAAALMASTLKGHDEIGLRIDCSGPVKGLVAEATATGEARGYLKQVPIPVACNGESTSLAPCWGDGYLTITRYLEEGRQPFSGNIALQSGDIAAEVARYYQISEQTSTTLHLSISFDQQGHVSGAGGLLLQVMPAASDEMFATLEQKTQTLPSLGKALAEGQQVNPWLMEQFAPFHPDILTERSVFFQCRCNMERMRLLLLHLPLTDLEEMRDNGPFPVEVSCHFCNKQYLFDQKILTTICQEKASFT
jgi:molecular chaperone Hsp33